MSTFSGSLVSISSPMPPVTPPSGIDFYMRDVFPTWEEFLNNDLLQNNGEIIEALKEYIYIIKNAPLETSTESGLDQNSRDLFTKVFAHLIDDSLKDITSREDLSDETTQRHYLPEFKIENSDFQSTIDTISSGVLAEASYSFALFYLCRQLAQSSGYSDENYSYYSLQPDKLKISSPTSYDFQDIFLNPTDPSYILITERMKVERKDDDDNIIEDAISVDGIKIPKSKFHYIHILFHLIGTNTDSSPGVLVRDFNTSSVDMTQLFNFCKLFNPEKQFGENTTDSPETGSFKYDLKNILQENSYYTSLRYTSRDYWAEAERLIKIIDGDETTYGAKYWLINWYAKFIYSAITNRKPIPESILLAKGDGSKTKGINGFKDVGIPLFQYKLKTTSTNIVQVNEINTFNGFPDVLNNSDILHINIYGNDATTTANTFTLILNGVEIKFESSRYAFHGLRPILIPEPSIDETTPETDLPLYYTSFEFAPTEYSQPIVFPEGGGSIEIPTDNEKIITFYKKIPGKRYLRIATFNRIDNDLYLFNLPDSSNFNIVTDNSKDEQIILISKVVNSRDVYLPVLKGQLFDGDKFEFKKNDIKHFFSLEDEHVKHEIEKIVYLIVEKNYTFSVSLRGEYIGKFKSISSFGTHDVEADFTFEPSYPSLEIDPASSGESIDSRLRFSRAEIKSNHEDNLIEIDIVSYVTKAYSTLLDKIHTDYYKAELTGSGDYQKFSEIDITTININKYTVNGEIVERQTNPVTYIRSYNQLLACLRSFGLLEGIAKYLVYQFPTNTNLKTKLDDMFIGLESIDNTAGSRDIPITNNIPNIPYEKYNSMKWYKSISELNKYEHDITF